MDEVRPAVRANTYFRLVASTGRIGKWHRAARRYGLSELWRCRCGTPARAFAFGRMEVSTKVPPLADSCKAIRKGLMGIEDRMVLSDSLDAAWAEAEAALPKGWRLDCLSNLDPPAADEGGWNATATLYEDVDIDHEHGQGPTPAAALRALAERLRAG